MNKLQAVVPAQVEAPTDAARMAGTDLAASSGQPFPENTTEAPTTDSQPIHLRDLVADEQNRRKHNPRNVGLIVDSIHRVGAGRSIVVDENNLILCGNATVDAAAEAGIERVRVVEGSGHEIIAVRRRGLTDEQKRYLALADNRAAELATWDLGQLRADVDAGLDLGAFFEPAELANLLGPDTPVPDFSEATDDEQGRLDRVEPTICPKCGHAFHR
jgi:hypothetical protein